MKLMSCVLGAVLVAAPMYGQTVQDQQPTPTPPVSSPNQNNGQVNSSDIQPNANTMPNSDMSSQSQSDQSTIYGTGLYPSELKQAGYSDDEIAQLRSESQSLMASSSTVATTQDRTSSVPASVSQPAAPDSNESSILQSKSKTYAGLWGLLGLLGLLGLAGGSRRQVVVNRAENDAMAAERDRMRMMAQRNAAERMARDREAIAAMDRRDRMVADAERDRIRRVADRDREAAGDREIVASDKYPEQDVLSDSELHDRALRDEIRDRKVMEIRERERNRRRIA